MLKYLIVCPLVFLAGFVDSIAGGGGLISLPAYMIAGLPAHNAISTNKISSAMGTAVSTLKYAKSGYIQWKLAIPAAVFSLIGSNLGARLSLLIDENILKIVMLFILPTVAILVLKGKALESGKEELTFKKALPLTLLIALAVGCYDGFYGPGTGTFLILLLTGVAHMELKKSNGISKVINLASNVSSLTVFLTSGTAMIPLGLTAAAFSIAGNYVGSTLFTGRGSKIAKPVMLSVLGVFFIKVILELCGVI